MAASICAIIALDLLRMAAAWVLTIVGMAKPTIMMMMPIVFLFITYTMPSGLLLYWTTSNLISIYQTTHTRRRDAKKEAAKAATGSAAGKLKPVENPKSAKPDSSKSKRSGKDRK